MDFPKNERLHKTIVALRVVLGIGIVLLVSGSCLLGNYKVTSSVSTGTRLVKAGYIVIAMVVAGLAGFNVFLWLLRSLMSRESSVRVRSKGSVLDTPTDRIPDLIFNQCIDSISRCTDPLCLSFCIPQRRGRLEPSIWLNSRVGAHAFSDGIRRCYPVCSGWFSHSSRG